MAEIRTADIVLSLTGRDRGQLMLVVAEEGDFLLLANGRARRAENPKRKRRKHVSLQGPCDEPSSSTRDSLSYSGGMV